MKNNKIILTVLVATAASLALMGCDAANQKSAMNTRQPGQVARAYTIDKNQQVASNGELNWVKIAPDTGAASGTAKAETTAVATNASPAALANIETAAGPGAVEAIQAQQASLKPNDQRPQMDHN